MPSTRVWLAVLAFAVVYAVTTLLMGGDGEVVAGGALIIVVLAVLATALTVRGRRVQR
jgi:hypothetical protein